MKYLDYLFLRDPVYLPNIARNGCIGGNLHLTVEHLKHFLKGRVLDDLEGPMAFCDPASDEKPKGTSAVGRALCKLGDRLVIWCLLSTTSVSVADKISRATVGSCAGA
jgi:hypothetical protein